MTLPREATSSGQRPTWPSRLPPSLPSPGPPSLLVGRHLHGPREAKGPTGRSPLCQFSEYDGDCTLCHHETLGSLGPLATACAAAWKRFSGNKAEARDPETEPG